MEIKAEKMVCPQMTTEQVLKKSKQYKINMEKFQVTQVMSGVSLKIKTSHGSCKAIGETRTASCPMARKPETQNHTGKMT